MIGVAVVRSRRLRDGTTSARGEPPGAPPRRRRPHDLEHARAARCLPRGDTDSALALSREALEVARNGDDPYLEGHALWHVGVALAARRGARRCRASARGGGQTSHATHGNAPERRLVAEVARGPRDHAGRSRPRAATVRREPGHPPRPGRRMGRLALSLQPLLPRARGRRRRDGAHAALRGARDRARERPSAATRERARDVGEARRRGRAAGARDSAVRPRRAPPRARARPDTSRSDGPTPRRTSTTSARASARRRSRRSGRVAAR